MTLSYPNVYFDKWKGTMMYNVNLSPVDSQNYKLFIWLIALRVFFQLQITGFIKPEFHK
jgi:hypothetical protein